MHLRTFALRVVLLFLPVLYASAAMMTRAIRAMATLCVGLAFFVPTVSGQVFISQYYEGTSNNKWIELYNAGGSSVDLGAGGYRLGLWQNAARENWKIGGAPSQSLALSNTVAPGATFVIRHASATNPVYAVADQTNSPVTVLNFNGDDSVVLYLGATFSTTGIVDSIGLIANTLVDTSIVRKASTSIGNTGTTDFVASEWDGFTLASVDAAAPSTLERIGYHVYTAPSVFRYVALGNPTPAAPYTSWATAATNIQDAIDAAADGETVLVSNGVYETGGRVLPGSLLTNRVIIDKPITVVSVNGPAVTRIRGAKHPITTNGDSAVRCVWMTNGATLVGFTLTEGATRQSSAQDSNGGGLYAQSSLVSVSNCVFSGNSADIDAGGAYGGTFHRCAFFGNRAAFGGGVSFFGNPGTMNNCVLAGNSSTSDGGGVFAGTLNNCTLTGNSASGAGGGVLAGTLNNCIVYFNTASDGPNSYFSTISHSCTTPDPGGPGNIANDPQFVSLATTNLALAAGSPCINRGDNAFAPGTNDLAGNPRVAFVTVDMGAYEYQTPAASGAVHHVALGNPNAGFPYTNWSTAAATIQDAIDAAVPGNTVLVSNGVYETGGRVYISSLLTNRVIIDKPITVQSVNGPTVTTIRGNGPISDTAVRCVWITNGASLVGFTLTNGATRMSGGIIDMNGGGLIAVSSLASVSNCIITGSSAAGNGGGVQAGTLNNCLLTGNSAAGNGGGARSAVLNNCTLAGNSAVTEGGGTSLSTLNNSIVYFNTAPLFGSENYAGGTNSYTCTTPLPAGTGNIDTDPLFVNAGAGNYRLQAGSPCRDTGANALAPGGADLDGKARIQNATVDLGAYELQLFAVTNTVPSPNASGVSPAGTIAAQFDMAPSAASVNPITFKAWGRQSGFYTGAYVVTSTTATFDPGASFKPGENVVVMLSSGIASSDAVLDPYQFEFHAAAQGCPQFLFATNGAVGTTYSTDIDLADLDRDGDLDAFVTTSPGHGIYTNNGQGVFTLSFSLSVPGGADAALGDLDGDGDLDAMLVTTFGSSNFVFRNTVGTTNGPLAFTTNSLPSIGSASGVALGDLDGDGDLDAFVSYADGLPEHVWLNDGSGNFSAGSLLGGKNSTGVALGDLDGDGDLDALVATYAGVGITNWGSDIYLNNGNGTFATNGTVNNDPRASYAVALGDLDGDGDLDAVIPNSFGAAEQICLNNGDATFAVTEVGAGWSTDVALGDLDGDGDLDAFITNENDEPDDVYLNNGSGAFTLKTAVGAKSSFGGISLGDLDGDGDLDAVVANIGTGNDVYLNVSCVDTGDLDADGIPTAFEVGTGMNPLDPADADADSDTDGFTGREEYYADTQPTNGASFFPRAALTNAPAGRMALVIGPTSTGRVYGVFANTNLLQAPQAWTLVPPEQTGTASSLTLTITNTLPAANYRTGVRLP